MITDSPELKFKKYRCRIIKAEYRNGQTALVLADQSGQRIAVATVALDVDLPPKHVLIKNWYENEGILEALTDAGVLVPTGRTYPTGWDKAHECLLLI